MKTLRIGMVMDPIESINPKKDSTLALMIEAQRRGWQVFYMTMADLFLQNGRAEGLMREVKVSEDPKHWYEHQHETYGPLAGLDFILMRKDPPFDIEYIMATYVLDKAKEEGAIVLNDPQSLRDVNEKVFTAWVPQCCPAGLFTRSKSAIKTFLDEHHKIVLKPTNRMGGQSIFVISKGDPNVNVIIEEMTQFGNRYVQAQKYIPEITTMGDKRILLINGNPVEYGIARIPGPGDHRGNLAVGAEAKGFVLTERDRWICDQLKPIFLERGLFFVGIDVIGDYLTEINVTSPTGIREINAYGNIDVAAMVMDEITQLYFLKQAQLQSAKS